MINPIASSTPPLTSAAKTSQFNKTAAFALPTTTQAGNSDSSVVSISPRAQIGNLGSKYDVTNISDNDRVKLANELKDRGLISGAEFADLTILIKPPGGSYDPNVPRNALEQFQVQLAQSQVSANNDDTKQISRITDLLQVLKEARNQAL